MERSRHTALRRLAAVPFVALLLLPASAGAADRFAEPDGNGVEPCLQADPCALGTAVSGATSGDDVTLLGGVPPDPPYTATSLVMLPFGVTVHGAPGARPLVQGSFFGNSLFFVQSGATLRDVDAVHSDTNNPAVFTRGTVERVFARSGGGGCSADPDSLVRDSVCWSDGTSRGGFTAQAPFEGTVRLRNVTAVATAGTLPGIGTVVFSTNATLTVEATNVIAYSAGGPDVTGAGSTCCTGEVVNINLDHSNFDTVDESDTSSTVTITDPGPPTNVTTPPVFTDLGNGDFTQASTSAGTINLGTAAEVNGIGLGLLDLYGQTRYLGPAPDIGADEFPAPPAPTGLGVTPASGSNDNNPKVNGTAAGAVSVELFEDSACTNSAATGTVAEFEGAGITVTVPDNSTTTFYAQSEDMDGTLSACSTSSVTYQETTPGPPGPPAVGPTGPTGQRAAALKKCAKIKKKAKKKRCKARARKLPV